MVLKFGRHVAFLLLLPALLLPVLTGCSYDPRATAADPAVQADGASGSTVSGSPEAIAEAEKRNGTIFVNWPKPRFVLVFTGELSGYIEPCGCAGLENLKGGLSRRFSLLKRMQEKGWPAASFDLGGTVKRVGAMQTEIKLQATVKGLIEMNYIAVGLGADDLRLPAVTWFGAASEPFMGKTLPLTSANVDIFGFESGATALYRTVTVGDTKIGVTAVLGDSYGKGIVNDGITIHPVDASLKKVLADMQAEQCGGFVLLCYAPPDETAAIAKRFPQFQYVVTAGGGDEPPAKLAVIPGTQTGMVEVGKKGQYASVIGFFDDPQQPVRYQRVPLDARFPESPEMKKLLTEYEDQLRIAGFANLGITEKIHPRSDPQDPLSAQFVGSESCAKCHAEAFEVWKESGHAHATETLTKLDPPRQFDPECLSCHVTGWDPQQYVPFQTGFLGLKQTPRLTGNGCENCHGPGGAHVAAESGNNVALRDQLRRLMHVDLENVERTTCIKCHDHDNSPEFDFKSYWPQIEH